MSTNHYDVIIIGSGAGGGTLFHRLATSGKRILLLERGDYVPREPENWSTRAVNLESRYQTSEHWRDQAGKDLHPHTNYWVGGNTKFYGAALFRLRKEDFGELRHHGGVSPAWPLSYEDLEPHTITARIYGRETRILDIPWLIRTKRAAGRPRDLEAIAELEALEEERAE